MTALKSFENGAKLERNAFQFENLIFYQISGPIKVKCQSEDSLILSITSTFKMILSDRGLDRRIQEMGLGNNMIQGIFS